MPKKSRRVAVRQAELGQRKRRLHRAGTQAADQGPETQVSAPTVQSTEPIAATSEATAVSQIAVCTGNAEKRPTAGAHPHHCCPRRCALHVA